MSSARSLSELIAWQLADPLKVQVYQFIASGSIRRDRELCDQLRCAAASAPRLIAEGFGRYLPGDFSRYLRCANGEFNESLHCLKDAVDRGYSAPEETVSLQRLAKRASKATTRLIAYLRTADAHNNSRGDPRGAGAHRARQADGPNEPEEPSEPEESSEPEEPGEPEGPGEPEEPRTAGTGPCTP